MNDRDRLLLHPSYAADHVEIDDDGHIDWLKTAQHIVNDHAAKLCEPATPVAVLTLVKSCPRCSGKVVSAVDDPLSARCAAGCGWIARAAVFS